MAAALSGVKVRTVSALVPGGVETFTFYTLRGKDVTSEMEALDPVTRQAVLAGIRSRGEEASRSCCTML